VQLLTFGVVFFLSCDPKDDPIQCFPDSIKNLDGIIFNGHITLCNAQGSNLVYEPGICSVDVKTDSIILTVFSTNPNYAYFYSDTVTSECEVYEGIERVYNLRDFSSGENRGSINETDDNIFFIVLDSMCPGSSFFEGYP
jgi:hypothetical protein